jgi:hypothetical protein
MGSTNSCLLLVIVGAVCAGERRMSISMHVQDCGKWCKTFFHFIHAEFYFRLLVLLRLSMCRFARGLIHA